MVSIRVDTMLSTLYTAQVETQMTSITYANPWNLSQWLLRRPNSESTLYLTLPDYMDLLETVVKQAPSQFPSHDTTLILLIAIT